MSFAHLSKRRKTEGRAREEDAGEGAYRIGRWAWVATLPVALVLTTGAAARETIVKFSLDYDFDGRAALFLLPLDKGYYKSEGLNVISRLQGLEGDDRARGIGQLRHGARDINALIRFRDANRASRSRLS